MYRFFAQEYNDALLAKFYNIHTTGYINFLTFEAKAKALGGGRVMSHRKKKLLIKYNDIISTDNLLLAWQKFIKGKKSKLDVLEFSFNLFNNILQLHNELANKIYEHGGYKDFYITDPKLRHIHKARVRDRLIHHAVYRQLYPFFAKTFIADSYSCQLDKGTHRALRRFECFARIASQNHSKTLWVLKCDIRKFFENIDHAVLLKILSEYIIDKEIIRLLSKIINSYERKPNKGLPLGNLTSQLFVNIYMNKFDQFVKHKLKAKYYVRYADDFVFMSDDKEKLTEYLNKVNEFLKNELKLKLHRNKIQIKTINSGVDFLGWIIFPHYRVLRTKTKKRMLNRLRINSKQESLASYLGLLKHGNTHNLQQKIVNDYWFWE